jgi:hypothetical protein
MGEQHETVLVTTGRADARFWFFYPGNNTRSFRFLHTFPRYFTFHSNGHLFFGNGDQGSKGLRTRKLVRFCVLIDECNLALVERESVRPAL